MRTLKNVVGRGWAQMTEPGRSAPCGEVLLYPRVFHFIRFCIARHSSFRVEVAVPVQDGSRTERAGSCAVNFESRAPPFCWFVDPFVHSGDCLSVSCVGGPNAKKYIFVSNYYWQRCLGRLMSGWLVGSAASEIERCTAATRAPTYLFASLYEGGCCRPSTDSGALSSRHVLLVPLSRPQLPRESPSVVLIFQRARRRRRRHVRRRRRVRQTEGQQLDAQSPGEVPTETMAHDNCRNSVPSGRSKVGCDK